jgi:hypothetical protein
METGDFQAGPVTGPNSPAAGDLDGEPANVSQLASGN